MVDCILDMDFQTEIAKYGLTEDQYEDSLNFIHKAQRLHKEDKKNNTVDWKRIRDKYNLTIHSDTLRKASQTIYGGAFVADYYRHKMNISVSDDIETAKSKYGVETSLNKDGTCSRNALVEITEEQSKDVNFMLEVHGFDSSKWKLLNIKNKVWNVYSKLDKISTLYSSAITAKPLENEFSLNNIDSYFKQDHPEWATVPMRNYTNNYDDSEEFLEVCVPDLHIGLKSCADETGVEFNYEIAEYNFFKCIDDIIERSRHKKFSRIYFVPLGDFLHYDNAHGTTTKGTPQDYETRYHKMFDVAQGMLIKAIDMLAELAPITIPYIEGNHDAVMGYSLFKGASFAYRNNSRVTFDCGHKSRKFVKEGDCLLGWCHGNMAKTNLTEWLQIEAREEFGQTRFAEIHGGHLHSSVLHDKSGIIVRLLPTITGASAWEYNKGYYSANKSMNSFVWNRKTGLRDIWFSSI